MDKIFINGNIITMDSQIERCEAVYIKDNIIEKVGTNDEILSLNKNNAEIIDLEGKTMLPGFIDSHMHLVNFGESLQKCDLRGVKSIKELIEKTKDFIKENNLTSTDWVLGEGWNHDMFDEKRLPTKDDLDEISKDIPISLTRTCLHLTVVNSKAIDICDIKSHIGKVKGGQIDVDMEENPTGVIRENAIKIVNGTLSIPTDEDIKKMIIDGSNIALSKGITSIHSDDLDSIQGVDYKRIINIYEELVENNELPLKIYQQCRVSSIDNLDDFIDNNFNNYKGSDFFKLGPIKLFTDGSLGSRTAALREPYSDDPSTKGIVIYPQEELDQLIMKSHNIGLSIAVHCIGDRSMDMTFESIKKAYARNPRRDVRHGIVHCQITDQQLMENFKLYDVIGYVQPIFLNYDLHIVEDRLENERASTSYNWKTMMDKGIHLAFGSDCPVETLDVMKGIYSAVTRKDLQGYPDEGWMSYQKISIKDAIYNYTVKGAYAAFEENIKGSITKGKVADLVVLKENVFSVDEDDIKDIDIDMTFVDGELKYKG